MASGNNIMAILGVHIHRFQGFPFSDYFPDQPCLYFSPCIPPHVFSSSFQLCKAYITLSCSIFKFFYHIFNFQECFVLFFSSVLIFYKFSLIFLRKLMITFPYILFSLNNLFLPSCLSLFVGDFSQIVLGYLLMIKNWKLKI